jgi:hypothetical protein
MRLMNEILHPFIDSFVTVYFNDILLFSQTWEEHIQHLKQVFEMLQTNGLLLNFKCEFSQQHLIHIGFVVGDGELRLDSANVKAILEWPRSNNVIGVRSFMRATQYLWARPNNVIEVRSFMGATQYLWSRPNNVIAFMKIYSTFLQKCCISSCCEIWQ